MIATRSLPLFQLTEAERLWLQEVYQRNQTGVRFTFERVRIALEGQIPDDFRYQSIDHRLLDHSGTSITILGILSLDPQSTIIEYVDKVARAIRTLIIQDFDKEDIPVDGIAALTGFTPVQISFYFRLLQLVGNFSTGDSSNDNGQTFTSVRISGNEAVFNNYMGFPGGEILIANRLHAYGPQPGPGFTQHEQYTTDQKLDLILAHLENNFKGNELQWFDLKNDIEEMRSYYSLPKKNWLQLLIGKLADWTVGGMISETISKEAVSLISGIIKRIGF